MPRLIRLDDRPTEGGPAATARWATQQLAALGVVVAEISDARNDAVLELKTGALSYGDLALVLGVSRTRAHQLHHEALKAAAGDRPAAV